MAEDAEPRSFNQAEREMGVEAAEKTRRAAGLAPTLIGLTESEARQRVEGEDGLRIRFARPDRSGRSAVNANFGVGRITAFLRDGLVVDANAG